jgi:putative peptidoglycan lipid II flippase
VSVDAAAGPGTATDEALETTRDSFRVAVWTALSRVSGLIRVMVIAAVLGPTFLGNTYQFANSVPNLVYYGLLGGALVSSLLVPGIVGHLSAGRPAEAASLARGLFGCAVCAAAIAVPIIIAGVPFVLRATSGGGTDEAHDLVGAATWLVALLAPQIVCYAVIACAVAVMNAHRRFALAAAAPMIENLGSIAVLAIAWAVYGTGREVTDVSTGEILLLGVGTTAAVILHACVQWFGARRCGVVLTPRMGWRDREVRVVAARSGAAMLQAGLWAVQLLVALALANRLAGGVVAVLIATNFFFLPIALAATPIALSALPRLAAHHAAGQTSAYADAVTRALGLTVFVAAPAAVGYLVLAPHLARVVAFGSSARAGARDLISTALGSLALGVLGLAIFTVATYAHYARNEVLVPLRAMVVQSVVAVSIMLVSLAVHGPRALLLVCGGLAAGTLVGAAVQLRRLGLVRQQVAYLRRSFVRTGLCVLVMAAATWACDRLLTSGIASRPAEIGTLAVSVAVGVVVYAVAQRIARAPELLLITGSLASRRRRARARGAAVSP